MKTFEELGVAPEIRKAIEEMGYENPMPVQEEVIPYLLGNGNDVVALAQTGTGKTAAFGLPLIQKIDVSNRVPQALILCPTRELCLQIAGDLNDYSKYITDLKIIPVYGGSSIESQIKSLKKGVHIIVATPGRLIDLIERKVAKLETIRDVVMDEADEMLNMGFTDSINAILEKVPADRNTLMFSATMSPEISRIAKTYLHDAKEITIGTKNEGTKNVHHVAYIVHAKDKYLALKRVVDFYPMIYGIIFCRTRLETQTDVAARGLDVNDLTHVINYGLPDDTESYTHRSGRTGRAGKTGISIAIMNLREKGKMKQIERILNKKFSIETLPTGQAICEQQLIKLVDDIEKVKVDEEEIEAFLPGIYRKLEWLSKEDLIKRVVSMEFNRFLDYYKNAPEIDQPSSNEKGKEKKEKKKGERPERRERSRTAEKGYTRLFINLGKTDGFFPNQVIELINRNLKKERIEVGRIDLMQNFSFFEVIEAQAPKVVKALNKATYNGRKVVVEVAAENEGKSDKGGKKRVKETKKSKSRREEPEYEIARKSKRKDDWKQFFQHENDFSGPDFGEEAGWGKKKKKRK